MKRYGYVQVSSKDQNIARQVEALLFYHIEENNIYIDKQSGKDFNRDEYNKDCKEQGVLQSFSHSINRYHVKFVNIFNIYDQKESYSFNYVILFLITVANERYIMNNEKLIEYLRGIVEIETSHYGQSELIKRLKKELKT